jgi:choline dehydrogenase-like flavoprotein
MPASVLLIGTGPAATAAVMALRRLGVGVEVLDVGYDLEPERERAVAALAARDPERWQVEEAAPLFPAPAASAQGVRKRFAFGSDFPYRGHGRLALEATDCVVDVSHALGGFGNVWGAAMLPWMDEDLAGWPISHAALAPSFRRVLEYVPSSAEDDDLRRRFPHYAGNPGTLDRTGQGDGFLRALAARRSRLQTRGLTFGRARLAVDASDGPRGCRYCGHCLEGCVYGSIFTPRHAWKALMDAGVRVHRGYHVLESRESARGVEVTAVNTEDGSVRQWCADRLLCAAGTLGSTRLMARSLGLEGRPVRILDSQYFFFPMLSYRRPPGPTGTFTLAEAFVELDDPGICGHNIHFQVYGMNEIFRATLRNMIPKPIRSSRLLSAIEGRFILFQGFLHSDYSGHMEMTIRRSTRTGDEVHVQGRLNPAALTIARRAKRVLGRSLAGIGVVPPRVLQLLPPGRSFHAGGSYPMGAGNPVFSSDTLGRPAGLERTHLLDASVFPSIPAATITLTAMANADRIVHELAKEGMVS